MALRGLSTLSTRRIFTTEIAEDLCYKTLMIDVAETGNITAHFTHNKQTHLWLCNMVTRTGLIYQQVC